jgi:endonuclease/exonuclease/phosphatase family metal-dependent hydrolase
MKIYHILGMLFLALPLFSACSSSDDSTEEVVETTKMHIGTYNVGHFNNGDLGGYQGDDPDVQLSKWNSWISQQKFDIFAVEEWNLYFDKNKTIDAKTDLLASNFKNVYFGPLHTWIYNGIATNYTVDKVSVRYVSWDEDYYALIEEMNIDGHVLTVMSTHIPWKTATHTTALNKLISEMKKYDNLICLGDMNALDSEQLNFVTEGFNIANGGDEGFFKTVNDSSKTSDYSIDNIVTSSNIKITNVSAPVSGLSDNDHNPLEADVEITWNKTK